MGEVSTSSARRERIFIEQRLVTVKQDLHRAAEEFSQFASQNTTLDVPSQTRAMVEAGADLQGNLMAAQSELEGLETDLYDEQCPGAFFAGAGRRAQASTGEMAGAKPSESGAPAAGASSSIGAVIGGQASDNQASDMIYPSSGNCLWSRFAGPNCTSKRKFRKRFFSCLPRSMNWRRSRRPRTFPPPK